MTLLSRDDILRYAKERAGAGARHGATASAPTDADDTLLIRFFNDALTQVAQATPYMEGEWTTTLLAGQAAQLLPDSIDRVQRVVVGENGACALAHEAGLDVRHRAEHEGAYGQPNQFGVFGRTLWMYPIPAAEEAGGTTVHVFFYHAGLYDDAPVADEGMPTSNELLAMLPQEVRRALADYVVGQWWDVTGEPERARPLLAHFELEVQRNRTRNNRPATARRPYRPLGF